MKGKKNSTLFSSFFLPKKPSMKKNFDVIFRPKCSLWNACTIYETTDPVFSLSSEISGIEYEKPSSKIAFFFQKKFTKKLMKPIFSIFPMKM